MRWTALIVAAMVIVAAPSGAAPDPLEAGFRKPPASAKPHTWWHWLNGNTSKVGITADLEAMKKAGIGGVQIFNVDCGIPDGPVPVMSDEWLEHTRHAIQEAGRLGIEVCIHNCPGWSSSGGPWVRPEHAMQMLVWTETPVEGATRFDATLRQPATRHGYYRDIAVYAVPTPTDPAAAAYRIPGVGPKAAFDRPPSRDPQSDPQAPAGIPAEAIVNLTDRLSTSGHLTWDVPAGRWTILRMGHTCTGAQNAPAPATGRGLEVDKLSRKALDAFWTGFMAKVIEQAGPLAGKILNNALIDSYETGYQNWTDGMREEFARLRGYDPLPYLPAVAGFLVDDSERSERFLWDFRRTVADLWAANYYAYFGELCRKNGLLFSNEPYGNGGFDNLQCGGLADIPMGEFWVPNAGAGETLKLAASAAHTNGRRIVGAESFTADEGRGRWLVEPYGIKALGDAVFCQGVNRYIFHRYAHQPWMDLYPGMTMGPWGTHLERTITWWGQAHAWFSYIARCQFLLQSGKFVADACYFVGEAGPNDLPGRPGLNPALPAGYDYDGCDATVLLNRMSVRNGRIVLPDGMSYAVLVLPASRYMTPQVARRIRELVGAGATVVGPRPEVSPSLTGYPRADDQVAAIGREVWGSCDGIAVKEARFGRGRIFWGLSMAEVLTKVGLRPDFLWKASGGAKLAYIHRRAGSADVYFVSNQQYRSVTAECRFRVSGRLPELWSPDTGQRAPAPVWSERAGITTVTLSLDPAGSVFVVFRKVAPKDHLVSATPASAMGARRVTDRIEVRLARYEARDGSRGADVLERVREMIGEGTTDVPATNETFGDPVPLVVKRLRIEWTLNGKPRQATVDEGGTISMGSGVDSAAAMDFDLSVDPKGQRWLTAWREGTFLLGTTSGRKVAITAKQAPMTTPVAGPWAVQFSPAWGGPSKTIFPKLISWSDHAEPGIRYYSGSATYTTAITVPASFTATGRTVVLDLGLVRNFAEVRVNGRDIGVLWKAPFRADVTGCLRPGRNTIQIRVTNLWPNRLIGDEQEPPEAEWNGNTIKAWPDWVWEKGQRPAGRRYTFTTWRFWWKNSPLLESGLIGPVTIQSAKPVAVGLGKP